MSEKGLLTKNHLELLQKSERKVIKVWTKIFALDIMDTAT